MPKIEEPCVESRIGEDGRTYWVVLVPSPVVDYIIQGEYLNEGVARSIAESQDWFALCDGAWVCAEPVNIDAKIADVFGVVREVADLRRRRDIPSGELVV